MSDKEKEIAVLVSRLPPDLQDKFLDQARGAAMALDAIGVPQPEPAAQTKTA